MDEADLCRGSALPYHTDTKRRHRTQNRESL